jgi:hypothetical protein
MTRIRTWTETITFRKPVLFKAVGEPLPAGTYEIEFEEHEFVLHGHSKPQIMRCSIPIPQSMLRPNVLGMTANIDHRELRVRQVEDANTP